MKNLGKQEVSISYVEDNEQKKGYGNVINAFRVSI